MSSRLRPWVIATVLFIGGCRNANGSSKGDGHEKHAASQPTPAAAPVTAPNSAVPTRSTAGEASHRDHPEPDASKQHEGHEGHEGHAGHQGGSASQNHAEHGAGTAGLPGYAAFTLDRARAAAVGLQLASVTMRPFQRTVRTTGFVVLDETRTSHVHSKVRGWIERVNVDFVGKRVAAGTPLCTIYSQEVLAAQLEFLSTLDRTGVPSLPGAFGDAEREARLRLIEAGRRRLALWDVPEREIERLESSRTPQRTFTLNAPRSGIVVTRQALPGMFVDPSVELYVVSDVSKLWLLADVYEADAAWVRPGVTATLRFQGVDSADREGKLAFIPPTLDEATRTLKVRFDLDNADGKLRPGAFASVELHVDLGQGLALPEESVIHLGPRSVVFVVSGERVEPRAVTLGPLVDGHYRVDGGLHGGESVAVGAQFLIDSESRLRATTGQGPSHAGH